MSNLSKSETLAKLTKLQSHLNELESAQREIDSCEAAIKSLKKQTAEPKLLRTDNHSSRYREIELEKEAHRFRRFFIPVALVFLGVCILSLLIGEFLYMGPDWSTPEMIGEYSGSYNKYYSSMDATLDITSCNKKGELEGTFEFFGREDTLFKDLYGKYSIVGTVQKKGENGDLIAAIRFDKWTSENPGETPFKSIEIKIYNNYTTLQNTDYKMILCKNGTEAPTSFAPDEIEGSYQENGGRSSFQEIASVVLGLGLIAFVVVWAIVVFGVGVVFLNRKQRTELAALAKLDRDNKRKNEDIIKQSEQDFASKQKETLSWYTSRLNDARQREARYEMLCNQSDAVSERDKHLSCVNYLIDQLSTGRADTLKEALAKYDIYSHQMAEDFRRQQNALWERQNRARALADMQNAQTSQNYRVRKELEKQTRELEEINERLKKLDD